MKRVINYVLFTSSLIFIGLNNTYAADCISCGTDILPIPIGIPKFVSSLITIAQVAVPVLIIVISMVNYIKAVGNGEDKVIREVNLKFIRSLIAGVAIFLLVAIVRFAFGTLLGATGNNALACISCFMDSSNCTATNCLERPDIDSSEEEDDTPDTYYCYVCSDDDTKRFWRTSNPGVTEVCPSGYQQTEYTQEQCNEVYEACYRCNTSPIYVWSASAPGPEYNNYACPAGWNKQDHKKSEESCKIDCFDYTTEDDCNAASNCRWGSDNACYIGLIEDIIDDTKEKGCEDYDTKDTCPEKDDFGRECEWRDNACKGPIGLIEDIIEPDKPTKKGCEDYETKDTCPEKDELGRKCQWKNNACVGPLGLINY